jgi:hypothetical protein
VALVADEMANPNGGPDLLGVLERAGWGLMLLAPSWYSDEIAAPLLEQVAEHVDEFARHGYDVILVGRRRGLEEALRRGGAPMPDSIVPAGEAELERFLSGRTAVHR